MSLHSERLGRAALLAIVLCCGLPMGPADAQPTSAQQQALRSNCRSDYMANCSSVTPGGREALQCLQRNVAKLSPACQSAVNAVTPPPSAPARTTAAPAAAPLAAAPQAPAGATIPTPEPNPAAPPSTAPARASRTTPAAAPATSPRPRQQQQRAAAPPAAPAMQDPAAAPMPPLSPRTRLQIVRACRADQDAVCGMVPMGGGRVIDCLVRNEPALSPNCKQALANARR